ncbi:GLE1-domain-containing protein [Xylaria sp. CBS 124048]|nr:GLE1-domain-containing protein [Xylaria sp. CBS 124048]
MTASSPLSRQSQQWSSPVRSQLSNSLGENRNSELSHQDALAAAQAEHERVRHAAIIVFKNHQFQEERRRIQEQEAIIRQHQRIEEERIRNEERLRAEQEQLRALRAKTVPVLPPDTPRQPPPVAAGLNHFGNLLNSAERSAPTLPSLNHEETPQVNGVKVAQPTQLQQVQHALPPKPFSSITPTTAVSSFKPPAASAQATLSTLSTSRPTNDRYVVIHQNLKKLRAYLLEQAKSLPALKARMGDMRRELRKCLGQIVTEKGGNRKQIAMIQALLQESLSGNIPSAMIDPSQFTVDQQRGPVDGALHNEAQLPSLFLYLLNIFAKTIINQFINECGAQPKAADPLGVITAQVFSNKAYLWRGKSLIDILMAKYRVVCPVLFGLRGSENTEQGRSRLGWRKEGPGWAPEQQHIDRMKGLAVGYAAISLRDFSKSSNTNPWPPTKYWSSMAMIVNTPPTEISDTQCVVLRAMIEIYEERFINFYGSAAIAALRVALIDFPNKSPSKTPGTGGLQVLAQMLKRDIGLQL